MVPSGWSFDRLGDVAELQRGFDLPSSKRIDGHVPIVSSSGVSGYHNEYKVNQPGIVTGRYGSIGNVYYVEEDFWPLNTSLWVKDFHGNYPKFIYYLLSSFDFKKFSDKTGVPGVNRNDLHAVKVAVPPLLEQKKIVKILSTWDKAISTTERLIDNSNQQKKALMQQLLTGKKRLLDDDGKRFAGDWEEGRLADFAKIKKGKALSSKDLKEGSYPVIAGGKSSPYTHSDFTHENIITVSASGAYAGYIAFFPYKIWASDCSVVEPKRDNNIKYLYYWLINQQQKIYTLQSGGAQPHIYPRDLDSLKISIPSPREQQKIATVLTNADKEIELLEQQLADLQQEKKALMQVLLTGKKRVVVGCDTDDNEG